MRNHSTATRTPTLPAARPPITPNKQGLLDALAVIDAEGWDCPTAAALLLHIREEIIRPLAADVGLRGTAASQAEATAWEAVWLLLCEPNVRAGGEQMGKAPVIARLRLDDDGEPGRFCPRGDDRIRLGNCRVLRDADLTLTGLVPQRERG